mgnify:CR=1 FL=1
MFLLMAPYPPQMPCASTTQATDRAAVYVNVLAELEVAAHAVSIFREVRCTGSLVHIVGTAILLAVTSDSTAPLAVSCPPWVARMSWVAILSFAWSQRRAVVDAHQ